MVEKMYSLSKTMATALLLALCSAVSPAPALAELGAGERAMVDWIDEHSDDAIDLLEELVNIGSGTMNHDGVRKVGELLHAELDDLGFETEWVELPAETQRAGHLVGRLRGMQGRKILLIGHLDTVFEAQDEFQAYSREGNTGKGPGIDDMKSGDVIIIYALKALREIGGLDDAQIVVYYTGDEEKPGNPLSVSRGGLIEAGKWADVALGFESAMRYDDTDWATIARRSSSEWRLDVTGRQAHSSRVFSEDVGAGAIYEVARILSAFYDRVRGEEHLTFNAGTILGGTDVDYDFEQNRGTTFGKTNVVPRKAIVHGGIRAISLDQLERAKDAMRSIVALHLPHTDASISFADSYPPMSPTEGNKRLQEKFSLINEELGRGPMPALDPSRRGAADVSFVAPYTDALAGLGAIGEGGHTPNESLELDSMPLAIKRAAILINRLSREH
jgi:glutamate carboxypeptidase